MNNFKMLRVGTIGTLNLWIARRKDFGTLSVKASINLLNPSQDEMEDAISIAERDLYSNIICYELSDSEFLNRQAYYTERK